MPSLWLCIASKRSSECECSTAHHILVYIQPNFYRKRVVSPARKNSPHHNGTILLEQGGSTVDGRSYGFVLKTSLRKPGILTKLQINKASFLMWSKFTTGPWNRIYIFSSGKKDTGLIIPIFKINSSCLITDASSDRTFKCTIVTSHKLQSWNWQLLYFLISLSYNQQHHRLSSLTAHHAVNLQSWFLSIFFKAAKTAVQSNDCY